MTLAGRDLITVDDLSDDEVRALLDRARHYAGSGRRPVTRDTLAGQVVATLFFEPSTRTRLSFEAAAHRLGADVIGFADAGATSTKKGETLEDTLRTVAAYADLIVVRHPEAGSAHRAAQATIPEDVPVVNAGDGHGSHPTQSLLDLYTLQAERGRLSDNHVVLLGDLKYGRTVHSLAVLLARFGNRLTFVAPRGLEMPAEILAQCREHGSEPHQTTRLDDVIADADVLYVTRVQRERFDDPQDHARLVGSYVVDRALLEKAKEDVTILHPLPRVGEIPFEVDDHPGAAYFRQVANGVPVRMAVLASILDAPTPQD